MQEKAIEAARRLHGLIEGLAHAYRGFLPHEGVAGAFESRNQALSPDTRTRLAHIEDTLKKADEVLGMASTLGLPLVIREEQTLWDAGQKVLAVRQYRARTLTTLEEAYCAMNGLTVQEYRKRSKLE